MFIHVCLCSGLKSEWGGLTFSKGAQLIADGAEGLVFGQGSVVCNPTLHIYHHLLLLIHRDMLW